MILQSSTPEEYLDGRVLADEAGLGDGPLAVEGDGGLPTQSGIDDRRDRLLLLQRLLLVSAKSVKATFVRGAVIFDVGLTSNTGQKKKIEKEERACSYAARGATSNIHVRHAVTRKVKELSQRERLRRNISLCAGLYAIFDVDKPRGISTYYNSWGLHDCFEHDETTLNFLFSERAHAQRT